IATAGRHHRDASTGRKHADNVVQYAERLRHKVKSGKAAHRVEGAVVEGQSERVTSHVHGTGAVVVTNGAFHHRHRVVQPDDESVSDTLVGIEAGEVARTACNVH